ncbi:MAG: hypothetical protein JWN70_820, partial [Planctomycetaceae bacterium]|nr:hypothetical protein [Planctomycetaceae bacterium]
QALIRIAGNDRGPRIPARSHLGNIIQPQSRFRLLRPMTLHAVLQQDRTDVVLKECEGFALPVSCEQRRRKPARKRGHHEQRGEQRCLIEKSFDSDDSCEHSGVIAKSATSIIAIFRLSDNRSLAICGRIFVICLSWDRLPACHLSPEVTNLKSNSSYNDHCNWCGLWVYPFVASRSAGRMPIPRKNCHRLLVKRCSVGVQFWLGNILTHQRQFPP